MPTTLALNTEVEEALRSFGIVHRKGGNEITYKLSGEERALIFRLAGIIQAKIDQLLDEQKPTPEQVRQNTSVWVTMLLKLLFPEGAPQVSISDIQSRLDREIPDFELIVGRYSFFRWIQETVLKIGISIQ